MGAPGPCGASRPGVSGAAGEGERMRICSAFESRFPLFSLGALSSLRTPWERGRVASLESAELSEEGDH